MNKKLYNMNKSSLTSEEQSKVKKQEIIHELSKNGVDNHDELAIILNVLEDNLESLKESKNKDELIALLEKRHSIKESVRGE